MSDPLGFIGIEEVEKHDDGGATFRFHLDDKAKQAVINEGIKILMLCAAYQVDVADVCSWIESHGTDDAE
jgi:hypothetical protein